MESFYFVTRAQKPVMYQKRSSKKGTKTRPANDSCPYLKTTSMQLWLMVAEVGGWYLRNQD